MPTTQNPSLQFDELLRWERAELDAWERFFDGQPHALDLPFAAGPGDDARMATVRGVAHHAAAVERRYADRLSGAPVTPYDAIPASPASALFDAARDANARLARWVAQATGPNFERVLEFQTMSAGTQRASARKIVAHALMHGVRTWAQVATVVRIGGSPSAGGHDLLFSDVIS